MKGRKAVRLSLYGRHLGVRCIEPIQHWLGQRRSYRTHGWAEWVHGWGAYALLSLEYGKGFARHARTVNRRKATYRRQLMSAVLDPDDARGCATCRKAHGKGCPGCRP